MVLNPSRRIRGRVLRHVDDGPLANARISVLGEHSGGTAYSDQQGQFSVSGLEQGKLQFQVLVESADGRMQERYRVDFDEEESEVDLGPLRPGDAARTHATSAATREPISDETTAGHVP